MELQGSWMVGRSSFVSCVGVSEQPRSDPCAAFRGSVGQAEPKAEDGMCFMTIRA